MTQLPDVTQLAASLWAKSPRVNPDKSQGAWLPVLNHLLDVAACAAEILELEPPKLRAQLASDLGLPLETGLPWVLALIALHDLGKASPAFQVLWEEGRRGVDPRLPFSPLLHPPFTPHGVVSEAVLPDFLTALGWPQELAEQTADAVGCHHGFRVEDDRQLDLPTFQKGDDYWQKTRFELCRLVTKAVGADYRTVPTVSPLSAPAFMRLAGLTSFADWLGSGFPLPTSTDFSAYHDPAAYFAKARAQARTLLSDQGKGIHWPGFAPLHPQVPPLEEVFHYFPNFSPRPLQTALAAALTQVDGPALVLVEAPMGEGKTEAALYAYLQLQHAAQHRGLYVALPTQATGSAMFTRLVEFLRKQDSKKHVSIQLAPGGALLNDEFQQCVENTRLYYRTNTDADQKDSVEAVWVEEWFTSRKRALLDEFGVGTVDQALLGVLGVSHQFVRLWGLANRVVVLDEVHAYDTYTSELIAALVSWLRSLGSSVVILSATLPDDSRRKLLRAWGVGTIPAAVSYPRWTLANQAGEVIAETIPATDALGNVSRPSQRVALRSLPGDVGAVAQSAVDLSLNGGCVAVIVNTVQRAQNVQQEVVRRLAALGLPARTCTGAVKKGTDSLGVLLYHARYPADERAYRERAVLKYLGKDGQRPTRLILIATQVAEQSLDFDADVMISDLAPMDLLLQRAGRLHRHDRPVEVRHAHQEPTLYVAGLDEWPTEAMKAEAWQMVYQPALLYRTWRTLEGRSSVTLPGELDALVQEVYGPPYPNHGLSAERIELVGKAEDKLHSVRTSQQNKGKFAHIGLPNEFWTARLSRWPAEPDSEGGQEDVLTSDEGESPTTRLGEKTVRIVPVMYVGDKWVVCPPPRSMQDKNHPWTELVTYHDTLPKSDTETAKRIFRRSIGVSRWEIVQAAEQGELWSDGLGNSNRGWRAQPLLRDVWPLDVNRRPFKKLQIELHPELGLVYRRLP